MSDQIVIDTTDQLSVTFDSQVDIGDQLFVTLDGQVLVSAPGIPGAPGVIITYIHTETTPSASWTITHSLNRFPGVSVVDSAGNVVVGDVQYITADQIVVTFSGAFSGKAYLN